MGFVYADITLINSIDVGNAEDGLIPNESIRQMSVRSLVDSGCYTLAINEQIRQQLKLKTVKKQTMELANSQLETFDIVGPVTVLFKNRGTICTAIVLPDDSEVLLGAIPLEAMDVLIDPLRNELIVNPAHPLQAVLKCK